MTDIMFLLKLLLIFIVKFTKHTASNCGASRHIFNLLFIVASQYVFYHKRNIALSKQKCTFLLSDEVLDNDISHAVSISIAILVEAMNCTEDKLVAGDGPILAAQHLDKR